jgi:hypothetical protein
VDLAFDPAHCGDCGTICGASQQCVDGSCGPTSAIAPYLSSVTPDTAAKDQRAVALVLHGARFQENLTVRMSTPLGARTVSCPGADCAFVGAGEVDLTVDLTGVGTSSPFTLRVVNPPSPSSPGVISNAVPLTVEIPLPAIDPTSPPYSVLAGSITTVTVKPTAPSTAPEGTFTSLTTCHLSTTAPSGVTPGANDQPLQTSFGWVSPDPGSLQQLQCVVDATALADGNYYLSVLSEAGKYSTARVLAVTPSAPAVYAVTPLSGLPLSSVNLTVTGDRFASTSKIVFDGTPIAGTIFGDSSHLYANGFTLPSTSRIYSVSVQTGTQFSNAVSFTVGSNPPTISSFSPAIAYQGDTVSLHFVGTNFPPASGIELQRPGSTTFDPLTSTTSGCAAGVCTDVSANKSFLVSAGTPCIAGQLEPEGTWNARVRLGPPGSPTTPSWPLQLLSSQAVLRNYAATPTPAQAGQVDTSQPKTKFTFQVSNLHPAPGAGSPAATQVHACFTDPDFPNTILAAIDPNIIVTGGTLVFDVTPPGTLLQSSSYPGGLPAGLYQFTIQNPNAAPSNGLSFNVTPGPPTLGTVCLAGTSCTNVAKQLPPPTGTVTITLAGTNFAFPDASGNNGSTVWVAANIPPGWDPSVVPTFACSGAGGVQAQQLGPTPLPATVLVRSATRIDVTFDTQNAYVDPSFGTTYYVSVQNPSGTGPPLKSGSTGTACTTTNIDPRTMPWFKVIPGP